MEKLIDLNVYGATCHMRLYADKLVVMRSDTDYKKLLTLMINNTHPAYIFEDLDKYARLKAALTERKHQVDGLGPRSMRKSDLIQCKKQIERRIRVTEELIAKNGLTGIWEALE